MNTKRILFILLVTLCVTQVLAACGAPATPTPDPVSVLQGYSDALKARDIDKVMSFVADDAVFLDQGLKYSGQAEIRASLQSAINDYVTVEVSNISNTNGRLVYDYKVFVGRSPVLSGTGLTIVQDGKIVFDGTEESWAMECSQNASPRFCSDFVPADSATIVQNFLKAVEDGDIEAAMALVADDIKCRGGVYITGKQSYRSLVQADINDGGRAEISNLKVEGDTVTYNWEAYSEAGFFQARGVDLLQIKDGLIVYCESVAQ